MNWFWGSKKDDDPTKSLNNDLKQFLDAQTPKPYTPAQPQPSAESRPNRTVAAESQVEPAPAAEHPTVPRESLYQDGRYKDLWKTYVPQGQIEEVVVTPAQRVVDAKKERKASLSQAALENCAFEEELKRTCFQRGNAIDKMRARLTLCNKETKAFNRCFGLQAKFLQALGYQGSSYGDPETDEKIQMHADKLYHRMMDYEAEVDEAKAQGKPIPPLTSIFNPNRPAPTLEEINLPIGLQKDLSRPLHELPPHEREVAARAILEETKVAQRFADDFFAFTTTLNEGRQERQKKLVSAFGETLGKFFIPDAPSEQEIPKLDNKRFEREFWKDDPKPGKG